MKLFNRKNHQKKNSVECVKELQANTKTFYSTTFGYVQQNTPVHLDRCYD